MLMSVSQEKLDRSMQKKLSADCEKLTGNYISQLEKDVSHFCKMYDYRNTGTDADWGNSKDSIERAIKFLTTR